jgi:manganese/iron transport system substrate-binding protein
VKLLNKCILSLLVVLPLISVAETEKFKVITTFTVIADIARNVGGDAAIVESITKPDAEIHNYQVTPGDIRRAYGSDLILYNGLNLELWFEKFFKNFNSIPSVVVTDNIKPLGISEGPYAGKPNPHAWMSTKNALIYIENIRKAFVKYDKKNVETYNKNAAIYAKKIMSLDEPFREKIESLTIENRWLVTSEGAFSYLAEDYGLKEAFLWPINADGQGTPQQVRKVIDLVRKNKIPAIFSESTVSSKPAKQVARETGARYGGVLYVDSLTSEDGKVPSYIDLLKVTLQTIVEALSET